MPQHNTITVDIHLRDSRDGYHVHLRLSDGSAFDAPFPANVWPWISSGDGQRDGQRLFDALFAGQEAREAWGAVRGRARLRLHLDTRTPELDHLPWERLHDGQTFLSGGDDTPFSRCLPVKIPLPPPIPMRAGGCRVLTVIVNPANLSDYGLAPLSVNAERATLDALWAGRPVTPETLAAPVTLHSLEEALREHRPHILHLIAHGAFNARRGEACLYLQNAEGNVQIVTDAEIGAMFHRLGAARPHLVFLAACESATTSPLTAFTGLARQLVQAGVPAVVGMQEPIGIGAARELTRAFYAGLFQHGEVDRALNAARSLLLAGKSPDAGVPVLLMRLKDGRLWTGGRAAVSTPANPFAPLAGRITDAARVFGRERELRRVADFLSAGSSVALIGPAAVGKSSLLTRLLADAPVLLGDSWEAAYLDLQPIFNEDEFFAALCDALDVTACRGYALHRALQGRRIVLAIDEVEKMTWDGFSRSLQAELRGLANDAGAAFTEAECWRLIVETGGHPQQLTREAYQLFAEKLSDFGF